MKLYRLLIISLSAILFLGCNDDDSDRDNPIPNVPVRLNINFNSNRDRPLVSSGSYVIYTKDNKLAGEEIGYRGVLVVSAPGINNLLAYSSVCPYNMDTHLEIVETNMAQCPKCGTKYNLWEGGRYIKGSGPSEFNMRRYRKVIPVTEPFIDFRVLN